MAKTKYVTYECPFCHRMTKMEVIGGNGEAQLTESKSWYRCTRCKHSSLINPLDIERAKQEAKASISRDKCTTYSNDKTYSIGEGIYHTEWDDVGRVIRKEKTSSGMQTIVVAFEKSGEKRLIENMPLEIGQEDNNIS
ncbi:MAG: hypothetical protein KBG83_07300 [Bacteroidetes bacterium]|nr:hypothetical protein [Bacteroidota bacterium]